MTRAAVASARMPTVAWLRDIVTQAAADPIEAAIARLTPLFADVGWLAALTDQWIAPLRDDPMALAALPATRNGAVVTVMLAAAPPVRLMLTLIEGRAERPQAQESAAPSIGFSGMHGLYRSLETRPLPGVIAYAPPGASRCRTRPILLQPDKTLILDERRLALRFAPREQAVLLLRARIDRTPAPLLRRYALDTGAPLGSVQGDDGFARCAMLLSVLRAAGARDAIPAMIAMLDRPESSERWSVMRELLALDAQAGWPHLDSMAAHDPDASVRAAAQSVLAHHASVAPKSAAPCPA